jgi:hypothetical protein
VFNDLSTIGPTFIDNEIHAKQNNPNFFDSATKYHLPNERVVVPGGHIQDKVFDPSRQTRNLWSG